MICFAGNFQIRVQPHPTNFKLWWATASDGNRNAVMIFDRQIPVEQAGESMIGEVNKMVEALK